MNYIVYTISVFQLQTEKKGDTCRRPYIIYESQISMGILPYNRRHKT